MKTMTWDEKEDTAAQHAAIDGIVGRRRRAVDGPRAHESSRGLESTACRVAESRENLPKSEGFDEKRIGVNKSTIRPAQGLA